MNEQEALNLILRNGKRDCVYSDEYRKLAKDVGMARYLDLHAFCRGQGAKDIQEWLIGKGLLRDVERDMREGNGTINPESRAEAICAQILDKYPLAGEPVLADNVLAKLFTRAQVIFDGIAEYGKTELSAGERDVLAITIIQYLKRRNLQEGGKSDSQFWPYIYTQFGYKQDNDKAVTQHIYNVLRAAVRGAFLQHDRFFSSEKDTQQYYTSLRLHALTPVQSMESLFEILLFFYMNDLEFSYVPEDPIFKSLVKCISTRWDRDIELQEELNVRSNTMASGLKALFRERPCFMRAYCEHIVQRIDAFAHNTEVLDADSTLDGLLREWYSKKEETLKDQVSQKKITNLGGERAVFSTELIRLRYVLMNRRVCISIPPIRLEDKAENYPQLELYQGENKIYSHEMEVYGRLSWTTREVIIPLEDINLDYGSPLNIEASISYNDSMLLKRDSKLHRSFIVFNEKGKEVFAHSNAAGEYYLFANDVAQIDADTNEPEWIDHDGQLMRLYVSEGSTVYVNGAELFLSKDRQGDVRCYPSVQRIDRLRGLCEGEVINLYPEVFKLDVKLPDDKRSLNYRIIIDGKIEPLSRYCADDQKVFVMDVPKSPVRHHSIQIVELINGHMACRFNYAILPHAKCSIENDLICDDGSPVTVHVFYDGCNITTRECPVTGTDWVTLSADHLEYDLDVKLPLVRGQLQEQNVFDLPSAIWREKITDAAFVKMHCPPDWSCRLYLGTTAVPQNAVDGSYELGNYMRTYKNRGKTDALILIMKNAQGQQVSRKLTEVVFEEYFTETPISVEDGVLTWHPENRYFGGSRDEFLLTIDVPVEGSPFTFALDLKNVVVDRQFGVDFPCGEFPYSIIKKRKSLFGAGSDRVMFEGTIAIGAAEQRRVIGKYLYLTRARCWDQNVNSMVNLEMPDTAGCLCNLQYQGNSVPSGESIEYPEYIGDLFFYNPSAQGWQYFNDQERVGFEYINPVHAWIISEQLMILRTVEEEVPYIDRRYNTILNRTLNLPNNEQFHRLILPDYFEYRME